MGVLRWRLCTRPIFILRRQKIFPNIVNWRFSSTGGKWAENNLVSVLKSVELDDRPLFLVPAKSKPYLPGKSVYTRGKFWEKVSQYATCLQNLGLEKGHRVAAQVSKTPENVALYLATVQLGGIFLPLNTDYTLDEIQYFLENSEPTVLVCEEVKRPQYFSYEAKSEMHLIGELELESLAKTAETMENICPVEPDDTAAICYTSGTTGVPKGAMVTHRNLITNAHALNKCWQITSSDILLHALPTNHVHGLFVSLNTVILAGGQIIFLPKFDAETVADFLPHATLFMAVPTYYTRLLHLKEFGKETCSNMRLFISGSAPLLRSTWREFYERTGFKILERYGMTEAQMVCSNPYESDRRKQGSVGPPLEGSEVRVTEGVLELKGPNIFKGYWRMPEKTQSEFTEDGFFISGDLAEIDSDGYVNILGREKDVIITGGLNVYPKEVEIVLDEHPNVHESAVIGVPHEDFGEAVVAVVSTAGRLTEEELMDFDRKKLAPYKRPKRVIFVKDLPKNAMGKVLKSLLRSTYENIFAKSDAGLPRT